MFPMLRTVHGDPPQCALGGVDANGFRLLLLVQAGGCGPPTYAPKKLKINWRVCMISTASLVLQLLIVAHTPEPSTYGTGEPPA